MSELGELAGCEAWETAPRWLRQKTEAQLLRGQPLSVEGQRLLKRAREEVRLREAKARRSFAPLPREVA